jgi:hypothetical protein
MNRPIRYRSNRDIPVPAEPPRKAWVALSDRSQYHCQNRWLLSSSWIALPPSPGSPVPSPVPAQLSSLLYAVPKNLQEQEQYQAPRPLYFSLPRFDTYVNNFIPWIKVANEEDKKLCKNPFAMLEKDLEKLYPMLQEPIIVASKDIMEAHNDVRMCKRQYNKRYIPTDSHAPTHASATKLTIELQVPRKYKKGAPPRKTPKQHLLGPNTTSKPKVHHPSKSM